MKLGRKRIKTTLGDLVTALTDAAFDVCRDEKRAYLLASLAIEDLFRAAARQDLRDKF